MMSTTTPKINSKKLVGRPKIRSNSATPRVK
jgi:hypothetical protein